MENFRYFLFLAYNGTGFHGWQTQPNAPTVQEELEKALRILSGKPVSLTGAGRTDTGVHARRFYAHFDTEERFTEDALTQLVYKLNGILTPAIVILDAFRVKPEVHARFSAVSRTYRYYISRRKDPFSDSYSWIYTRELDLQAMSLAAEIIREYTDFTCFSKSGTQTRTNDCVIIESFFLKQEHMLIYQVKANRFLRNMVRAIVGTLLEVGKGSISIDEFRVILEEGSRSDAGMSVPACGLFLEDVEYTEDIRLQP